MLQNMRVTSGRVQGSQGYAIVFLSEKCLSLTVVDHWDRSSNVTVTLTPFSSNLRCRLHPSIVHKSCIAKCPPLTADSPLHLWLLIQWKLALLGHITCMRQAFSLKC